MPNQVALPADESGMVRTRMAELGLPGLIDVHTHFMPEPVLAKVWGYFDAAGPLVARPWPIAYRTSEEQRLATLRSFGVVAFPSLNYPHKPGMAAWLNAWSAAFAARHPDCIASATFFPEPGAAAYVQAAISAGARVFKAHIQVGGYDPNDPQLDDVWRLLEAERTPIVIHAGHGPAPGAHTGPDGIRALLHRFPELTLIVAHLGMPDYAEFLDLAAAHNRVHLDTTIAFTRFTEASWPFPRDRLPQLLRLGDRILFGSDFPSIPYPYLEAVDAVLGLGLGQAWMRGVFYDNAARLFSLDLPEVPSR
ncbi:MAG: amidohydrolase family protein [Tetrasphaera sp.]